MSVLSPAALHQNRLRALTSFSIIGLSRLPAFENFHQLMETARPALRRWGWRLLAARAVGLLGHAGYHL